MTAMLRRQRGTRCVETEKKDKKDDVRRGESHDRIRYADKTCLDGGGDQHHCRRKK